jgi:glycosyltransferase involved in cell wall biosynthesis
MDILILSAHLPTPSGRQGGLKSSYFLCRQLAAKHQVHLLSFATPDENDSLRPIDREIFHCCTIVPVTAWKRLWAAARSPYLPVSVASKNSSEIRRELERLLATHHFDVAILDHASMWQYTRALESVAMRVGSAHDVLSQLWERKFRTCANPLGKAVFELEYWRVRNWERSRLRELDFVSPHNPKDAQLLQELAPAVPIFTIQPWFTMPPVPLKTEREPNSLVFLGAMDRSENLDAVEFAAKKIFPLIKNRVPNAKLYVVGNHGEKIKRLSSANHGIIVTGFVEKISEFLARMQVALLPLRLGAGIKIKTLECMAAGLAIVTTPVGVEGIAGQNGIHFKVGETAVELAQQTVELLESPSDLKAMGENARGLILRDYDFEEAVENLNLFLVTELQKKQVNAASFRAEVIPGCT